MSGFDLYLASRSPRRAELLDQIGVRYEALSVDVSEIRDAGERPDHFVLRAAADKARAGAGVRAHELPVLGADTAVVVDGEVLGKPGSREQALAMLEQLSGRGHRVLTAVALAGGAGCETALSETRVWFRELDEAERIAYWDTGEPADKAGGYGIQGLGAVFVERIEGSYSGVMGLPLFETARLLARAGIPVPRRPVR